MGDVVKTDVCDGIAVVTIDHPPVNALSTKVRRGIADSFATLAADDAVNAIVLACAGRTFVAGADISEFDKAFEEPDLMQVLDRIERLTKPVVAAIHGSALGGGLELALVCHYRIAVPSAKVGLPEVHLGLLPGAGGTQRLPRLVGAARALEMIVRGKPLDAKQALDVGLVDSLAGEGELLGDAIALAKTVAARGSDLPLVRNRQDMVDPDKGNFRLFAEFRKTHARATRGLRAPENIIKAVEAAVELPFDAGMKREKELFDELYQSPESAAQRYCFFAERETTKVPDVPSSIETLPIRSVGVIGAGTMGGGITMNFLNAGVPVTLVEMNQEALDRGMGTIRRSYEATAKKGRMTQREVDDRLGRVTPSLNLEALAEADLVIEAVFEDMAIKLDIFGKIDRIAKPGAILTSNTSFLDIDQIAAATSRPEWVIGLHFFSPANVMRLLEVVRGAKTLHTVIATAMKLARQIGKVPVLSRVCHGFIANRVMGPYAQQASTLTLEGPTPTEIDKVLIDYGFAMGPLAMHDLVGLDVIGPKSAERTLIGDFVRLGRLGQKNNGGFYDYDEHRRATPSPIAEQVITDFARHRSIAQSGPQGAEEILGRLLYPVVNEGAKVLEEGIAIRASDIDIACIFGYNWPTYTGGPMFWAETIGLPRVVAALKALQTRHGDAFRPARLLEERAASGGSFTQS